MTLRPLAKVALQKDGGSVIFASRFVHDMAAFKQLKPSTQSQIISRKLVMLSRFVARSSRVSLTQKASPFQATSARRCRRTAWTGAARTRDWGGAGSAVPTPLPSPTREGTST